MYIERDEPVGSGDGCGWRSIDARIDLHCRRTPDAVALDARGERLTYAEMSARIATCAAQLAARVPPGARVAVCLERTVDMPVWLYAILRAGAAYVPIDPTLPPARIAQVLGRAAPALILVSNGYREVLPPTAIETIVIDAPAAFAALPVPPRQPRVPRGDDLAYVIFTSGSTGESKGVEIEHRALTAMLDAFGDAIGHRGAETLLALTRISFDLSVVDLFLPTTTGGTLALLDLAEASDPTRLAAAIGRHAPDMIQATPATWRALLEWGWQGASNTRIVCGGEAMTRDLADRLLPRCRKLWNAYGPTETTVWSAVQRVTPGRDPVAIGRPLPGTTIRIADHALAAVPDGDVAEIVIGGPSVARGYCGRPDLTGDRFVMLDTGARAYRTGDLGRVGDDGLIYCMGRLDDQVKVRGFRIELGDVEAGLAAHPDVAWCAARVWPDQDGETVLVGYVVPRDEAALPAVAVRTFLSTRLPDYMIPGRIVPMVEMPLTPNGKVDRSALPNPLGARATVPPSGTETVAELRMAAIWCDLLGIGEVSSGDDFFDLGGYSLITVRLMRRIEQEFGCTLELVDLIRASTLSAMTALVSGPRPALTDAVILLNQPGDRPPLYWLDAGPLMRALARGMAADQPVFALNLTRDEEGALSACDFSVAAVAAVARRRLLQAQPEGPYYIGGWCRWGIVAHELACQLRAAGHEVAQLVLLDAVAPGHLTMTEELRIGLRRLRQWCGIGPARAPRSEPSFSQRVELATRRHRARRFDGNALLLRAERSSRGALNGSWRSHVSGRLVVETVPGDHESMVRAPYVLELARTLDHHLMDVQGDRAPSTVVPQPRAVPVAA